MGDFGSPMTMFGQYATQIGYPASIGPLQGVLSLNESVQQGTAALLETIAAVASVADHLILIGVSQGGIVLSLAERTLLAADTLLDLTSSTPFRE